MGFKDLLQRTGETIAKGFRETGEAGLALNEALIKLNAGEMTQPQFLDFTQDMTSENLNRILQKERIPGLRTKEFEGYRPTIYRDTVGKRTVGYGFNIDDPYVRGFLPVDVVSGKRPITQEEADTAFKSLYSNAEKDAIKFLGKKAFNRLSFDRQEVLIDMAYNMGYNELSKFKKMRAALQAGDTNVAAKEMKNSDWFAQVGKRSEDLYEVMKGVPVAQVEFEFDYEE